MPRDFEPLSFDRERAIAPFFRVLPVTPRCVTSIALLAGGLTLGCGGRPPAGPPPPASPEGAVHAFMEAVRASDLRTMGGLWGSARGPAASYMRPEELEKRLTVIRIYLEHESYEILPAEGSTITLGAAERDLRVRLARKGCTPVVPVRLVQHRGGWLVSNVDLTAAGNPARPCN